MFATAILGSINPWLHAYIPKVMYAIVYFTVEIDTLVCRCSYYYVSHAKNLGTSSTSSHMHIIRQVANFLLLRCSCALSGEQLHL